MKILYAIQGTGNGHVSRAREIIPHLANNGDLDVLISGTQSEVNVNHPVKYKLHGWSFTFGKKGGVDLWDSWKNMRTFRLMKDVWDFPVHNYDLIINDFEPVTAWACKLRGKTCVAMSHQAAFLSKNTPRPDKKNPFVEWVFHNYSPSQEHIGFHFERYDDFIRTPVIREDIRKLEPENLGHVTVYLPAHDDKFLVTKFTKVNGVKFEVFSKHTKTPYRVENTFVYPINSDAYTKSLEGCMGLITAGGFEAPTEAIFLNKKVMVVPMIGQYEQHCNALGAKKAGCTVITEINGNFLNQLNSWIEYGKHIHIDYPDETADFVGELVAKHRKVVMV
ncbi:MAG: glycosyltransferase family protein [Bacteroidota bacterium]|jgi:uncharacterized protein (TIGR00661 family)